MKTEQKTEQPYPNDSSLPSRSKFAVRSYELEHLDTGNYTPEEYEGCITELQVVNRWLGDVRALRESLFEHVKQARLLDFSLLDVGAGSGELLRVTAKWAREQQTASKLFGLELNRRSAEAIKEESTDFKSIFALQGDALRLPFADRTFDYALCSLFTHHFKDEQVVSILKELARVVRRRFFVIDLHRHPVAYYFYTTIARLFSHNRLIREDGALSIRRGFKPHELSALAQRAELDGIEVTRVFPYRLVLTASTRS
jgi:ubiquinone/menaquinone biosynthesis C-methylase UbiE